MKDLKETLFFRAMAEYECYCDMRSSEYSVRDIEQQEARFYSVYQIIEEAELKDEYAAYVKGQVKDKVECLYDLNGG